MKYFLSAIGICAILCFQSCSTSNPEKAIASSPSLAGNWELRETTAAMMPGAKAHLAGNGSRLQFTETTYEQYENGKLINSGKYNVVKDSTVSQAVCLELAKDKYPYRIIFEKQEEEPKEFFELVNNKITFISGCYASDGGHTKTYEKQ